MTDVGDPGRPTGDLVIIETLPLPSDVRARRQCQALLDERCGVTVISPADEAPRREELASVALWTRRNPSGPLGAVGFARAYLAGFVMVAWLSSRARRRHGFDLIQACNPPEFFFIVAWAYRWLGVRFVFDLATEIDRLSDDPERRRVMGRAGPRRLDNGLSWDHHRTTYFAAMGRVEPSNQ